MNKNLCEKTVVLCCLVPHTATNRLAVLHPIVLQVYTRIFNNRYINICSDRTHDIVYIGYLLGTGILYRARNSS